MYIEMKKVIICNFLSYGYSELDLTNKGYCLVKGINKCKKDNALSNGSGKSSWSSAICWCLTGETINGLKSNLKNINVEEKQCYVTLEFIVDGKNYVVTRYVEPKSDLRITCDGKDLSGKGIRESQVVLSNCLPDLTSQLLGSIIILGQGLPCKFTGNTPSGRKEVLEHLAKSDFMIQDLKDRISNRNTELNGNLREVDDKLLVLNTKLNSEEDLLNKNKIKLTELEKEVISEDEIEALKNNITKTESLVKQLENELSERNKEYTEITNKLNEVINDKDKEISQDNEEFNTFYKEYLARKSNIDSNIIILKNKIKSLKDIKDICPTCGQKIPNVIKPSTEKEEDELKTLNEDLNKLTDTYNNVKSEHDKQTLYLNNKYKIKIDELNNSLNSIKQEIAKIHSREKLDLSDLKSRLVKLESNKMNHEKDVTSVKNAISENETTIKNISNDILYNNNVRIDINKHLTTLNQINTLVKRDFRGFLLSNVIEFINCKAKEYSIDIFNNNDLEFKLDGNNIDILYSNKYYESLSGGEKQKLDLIIQFAIRDMMKQYLNFSSNILVLDEILDNLDVISSTNVLNFISNRLNDVESIFIVSHHAEDLEIPVDSELIITKDEFGISTVK